MIKKTIISSIFLLFVLLLFIQAVSSCSYSCTGFGVVRCSVCAGNTGCTACKPGNNL